MTNRDYLRGNVRYSGSSGNQRSYSAQGGSSRHVREVSVPHKSPSLDASTYGARLTRPTARELYPEYIKKRKHVRLAKRVGLCMLSVLLVLVCAVGGYALWYSSALDGALSMGAEQDASVDAALTTGVTGEPFYMLLLGSDSREGSGTSDDEAESGDNQRSDVMILARIDAKNSQVTLVSIPRDTPLKLENGGIVKMNEAYNIGGAAYSIKAVSELTGVPISHYAEIHFSEFQEVVDKLGGVTVDVDTQLSYEDALTNEIVTIEPGTQTLNGQQAQIFARARHEYETDQDAHRQDNVRSLVEAIMSEVLSRPLHELPGTVLDLATCVGTDMNTADIMSLALAFGKDSGDMTVYNGSGPTDGDINEAADGAWLCYENPEGWATLMGVVDAGEDPSGLDLESTAIIHGAAADEAA